MSPRRAVAALVALLCVLAGCGVPADPAPRDIPAEDVPFGLLDTATTTTTGRPLPRATVTVFLVNDDRLAAVDRQVPAPASAAGILAAVPAGPTPQEAAAGLRSALTTQLGMVEVTGGIATVTLSQDFANAPVGEQILALAQLVYTATELGDVHGVQFTIDGRPTQVPTAQGTPKRGVVTREDFAAVAPAP
jgi:spore germination protein GerM